MKYIISLLLVCFTLSLSAQELPERGVVRRGNKAYQKEDYAAAAESYTKAMTYAPESFEPRFNLGNALFKGEKLPEAEKVLNEVAADSLLSDLDRSAAYFNLGNSQFQQKKLKEALESYKNAIRFDPADQEAKYNYAYTKAMLDQNDESEDQQQNDQDQQNQDQNQDQQDQNKDNGQNDQQDQNQDQQDQQGDQDQQDDGQDQNQDQNEGDGDQDEQPQGDGQPQESQLSDQQQQQMLDAVQAQEDKTQEDLEKRARGIVVPGAKNW